MSTSDSWFANAVSDFRHPPISVSARSLIEHFESDAAKALTPLRNPHHEAKVDAGARRRAKPAAVLIPVVEREPESALLLTRRHHSISYPGHVCFPGGRCDAGDPNVEATALREAQEEIGLDPRQVRVVGRLGDYVTHSGYRIAPVVALLTPPLDLVPREGEVEEIVEIPFSTVFRSDSYCLARRASGTADAHFFLEYRGAVVSGPTVSLLMGLYEALLETHRDRDSSGPGRPR
jgi:8-oxo-dGTP pyrophosphatase MutT (NUDIX family)